jgi:hypothetical protein
LKAKLPKEKVVEFKAKEEKVKFDFQCDIEDAVNQRPSKNGSSHVLSSINLLALSFEQNENAEAKAKELRVELEPLYREIQLFYPKSKENFITSLWWLSQQGKVNILDSLRKVKAKPSYESEEIMFLLEQSSKEICKRECRDLLSFYKLKPDELTRAIDKMIRNEREAPFAPLPDFFAPKTVEKAITQLENTKEMIEKVYEGDKLESWLSTPNRNFLNKSPKEVILKGKAFRILQHFIGLGEGIF